MSYSRFLSLTAIAALLSAVNSDPNSVCNSFGVDFVDEGDYFINSNSNEPFTCVSTFQGCNNDIADVLLVNPSGDEFLCSRIASTVPDGDPKLSTCPLLKSQLFTGDYMILVLGDNADGNPFAWQRDIFLEVGPQSTTTVTPTVTFSVSTTPTRTSTTTTTFTDVKTTGPFTTVTLPSSTASITKTVTPPPVTNTRTFTFTQTTASLVYNLAVTTKTVTASCTKPPRGPHDKPCTYTPTKVHAKAVETPTGGPKLNRYVRKSDRAVSVEWARARIEAAKQRRDAKAQEGVAGLQRRAPDPRTLTVTADSIVSATTTITAPAITTVLSVAATTTSTTTLPPTTIYQGVFTSTVTLATPTKSQYTFALTTVTRTFTVSATFTKTTTVTPKASVTACRNAGGHF